MSKIVKLGNRAANPHCESKNPQNIFGRKFPNIPPKYLIFSTKALEFSPKNIGILHDK
jgi:hypothetical protein